MKFKNGYNLNFINVNEVDLVNQEKLNDYFNFINKASIKFDSLDYGYTQIKFRFLGVSGVYKLTSKLNPERFYIGSSNNLARRIGEYENLTKGLRKPQSSSELEISNFPASNWELEILYLTTPQLSLIYEQYAILDLNPTINVNLFVIPRINPQWGDKLDQAIDTIKNFINLFPENTLGFKRFNIFLKVYLTAKNLKFDLGELDSKIFCFLVFVYDIYFPDKDPVVYSSVNKALKSLGISYGALLDHIKNKYIYKANLAISF